MTHADTISSYWAAAEARDWDRFADLLAPDVVYTLEQSVSASGDASATSPSTGSTPVPGT